jgi:filamentous hemagglutinin family protein
MLLGATALGYSAAALADPTGGVIVGGAGTISQSGPVTDINQATARLDINWQTFSIGLGETVNFYQPSASAVAINHVLGGVPSQLAGALNANGQVYILNGAGIVFHQSAQINVGALLATTATDYVDNSDGSFDFSGSGFGEVINQGSINISNGGFAVLAAPYVENSGIIRADLGSITLASTNAFTLDMRGDGLITFAVAAHVEGEGVG